MCRCAHWDQRAPPIRIRDVIHPIPYPSENQCHSFITKRRLFSLVSASAFVGTMAVAAVPASTMAASLRLRPGSSATGSTSPPPRSAGRSPVRSTRPAATSVSTTRPRSPTPTSMALGSTASSSTAHATSTPPTARSTRSARRRSTACSAAAPSCTSTARTARSAATRSTTFQKNGIEVRGLTADASAPASNKTSVTIANNVVTGRGHIDDIAQNGIVILGNASATVKGNTVSHLWYTGRTAPTRPAC